MNLAAWPPSLLAVAALTLFAVIVLLSATRLTGRPGPLVGLGLLGVAVAALPALLNLTTELPAVLGVSALAAVALLLLPSLELQDERHQPEVVALLLLGSAGAIVLATADNLLSLVLGLETLSLSVAVVTALGRGQRPLEASFKYFVLAAISVAVLIYGVGLYVLATGSLSLAAQRPTDPALQIVYAAGLVLVALGFAFELAVAPLHWGALGAYVAAPPGLAGYIMSASKLGAVLALSHVALLVGAPVSAVLVGIGVLSIGWGTFGALAQRDLRGLLGYSAIAQAGFLALALGSGPDGRTAAVFYVVTYAATAILVFAALSGLGTSPLTLASLRGQGGGTEDGTAGSDTLRASGLGTLRGLALALGLLSLAGIPPTPGFWAKLAILGPAWAVAGVGPTLVAVIGGVAGALYYLRPLPDIFAAVRSDLRLASSPLVGTAVALAGIAVLLLGLAPGLAWVLAGLSQLRV